jgi:hypothetical protein
VQCAERRLPKTFCDKDRTGLCGWNRFWFVIGLRHTAIADAGRHAEAEHLEMNGLGKSFFFFQEPQGLMFCLGSCRSCRMLQQTLRLHKIKTFFFPFLLPATARGPTSMPNDYVEESIFVPSVMSCGVVLDVALWFPRGDCAQSHSILKMAAEKVSCS